jgi:hypothetical protein
MIREPFAEFLGVAILIIFGNGVDCQVVLSGKTAVAAAAKGVSSSGLSDSLQVADVSQDYLSINFGWAVGTAMGVWVSGGISGGHINPAVSTAGRNRATPTDIFRLGNDSTCDFQRVPLEESSSAYLNHTPLNSCGR